MGNRLGSLRLFLLQIGEFIAFIDIFSTFNVGNRLGSLIIFLLQIGELIAFIYIFQPLKWGIGWVH